MDEMSGHLLVPPASDSGERLETEFYRNDALPVPTGFMYGN